MIEDASAPGGYRVEGTLRIPIAIGASPETKSAGQAGPDRRLRRMVAGACNCPLIGAFWLEEAFAA